MHEAALKQPIRTVPYQYNDLSFCLIHVMRAGLCTRISPVVDNQQLTIVIPTLLQSQSQRNGPALELVCDYSTLLKALDLDI